MKPLLVFTLLLMSYAIPANANNLDCKKSVFNSVDNSWTLDTTISNVSFYYKVTICDGRKVILLAIENSNAGFVAMSWKENVSIDGLVQTSPIYKTFLLPGSGNAQASCNGNTGGVLIISSDPSEGKNYTGYKFSDITVKVN